MAKGDVEIWKDIPGYEGAYQCSTLGRVRSVARTCLGAQGKHIRRVAAKILKQSMGMSYPYVGLRKDGKCIRFNIHTLVLSTFVGPCPAGHLARHFPDRDTTNNRLSNLQWGTPKENTQDRRTHGTMAGQFAPKLTARRVRQIRKLCQSRVFNQTEIGEMFGIHQVTVSDIHTRKIWSHLT